MSTTPRDIEDLIVRVSSPIPLRRSIGALIRARRLRLKMSQADVAGQLGVSQALVGQWETGKTRLMADDLLRLAKALKTTQAYLLGETPPAIVPVAPGQERSPEELIKQMIIGLMDEMDYNQRSNLFFEAAIMLAKERKREDDHE